MFEEEMQNHLSEYLKKEGFEVYSEIRFLEKKIDLIYIKRKQLISIELKVQNWKRALWQAYVNQLFTSKSYVCLWSEVIKNIDKREFEKFGIGVLSIDENSEIKLILDAKTSQYMHLDLLNKLVGKLNDLREN